jgi:hypothetical protein
VSRDSQRFVSPALAVSWIHQHSCGTLCDKNEWTDTLANGGNRLAAIRWAARPSPKIGGHAPSPSAIAAICAGSSGRKPEPRRPRHTASRAQSVEMHSPMDALA